MTDVDQGSSERQSKSPQSCARAVAKKAYEWHAWDYRIVSTAMRNVGSRRYKYEEAWDQIQISGEGISYRTNGFKTRLTTKNKIK